MKFYKISIIFLFLFIVSIGVVCAEDANHTTQDALEISEGDVALEASEATYTDLGDQIKAATDSTVKLENDYKYNDSDKLYINLNHLNLTIDGNEKSIDGNNKAGFLKISNHSNVIIKNLFVKNCNNTAIIVGNSKLTLINVTFENNHDKESGAAVYARGSNVTSTDTKFLNNYAFYGSAIYSTLSNVTINNGLFKNDNPVVWSLIRGSGSALEINNTIFANTTSKYATAIYNNGITTIKKSKFLNLVANVTAGAIAVKGSAFTFTTIDDCQFINVTSSRNGGALYLDIAGDSEESSGIVSINNTLFKNCSSEFGGAVLQLDGILNIFNSQFEDNFAVENGGAVYTSYANLIIKNTNFTGNNASTYNGWGGAVFFDKGIIVVDDSTFKNNGAKEGAAIFSYDGNYQIKNSKFENNANEDIHTYFDVKNTKISNCGNVKKVINSTKYPYDVRYNGNRIVLNRTEIKGSANDPYFNLNDLGLVTPVRNQGSMGACWAFGAAGAFESAFLIATNISLDISENNIQNMGLRYSIFGSSDFGEAGTYFMSAAHFLSWLGAINSEDDTYDELGKISALSFSADAYHIVDAIFVDVTNRTALKEALVKYGALNLFVFGADSDNEFYNDTTHAQYTYGNHSGNHYVTLVGWNDTYEVDNFIEHPPGPGAWICKNSWGNGWGDNGFYYLSYYDVALDDSEAVGFIIENTEQYEKLYQNELGGYDKYDGNYTEYADTFVSQDGDIIAAVGTFFEKANSPYTISIYVNDYKVYSQSGRSRHAGYNTIKLNNYVAIEDGSVFRINIKSTSTPVLTNTRQHILTNNSFVVEDGSYDFFKNAVVPIKVYTYHTYLQVPNIVSYKGNGNVVLNITGSAVGDVIVNFKGTTSVLTLEDGKASIDLGNLPVGDYVVSIYYNNSVFISHVKVFETTIDYGDSNTATFAYNTDFTFTVKLVDCQGQPIKNTEIPLKFDGETVKGLKTDENGYLDVRIFPGNTIGKHYLDYTNPISNEKLRVTLNIVSRFAGNANVNMYYFDGHSYKVRIRSNDGNFAGSGQVITVKIGKKSFKVKTDKKGYATLKIPKTIKPGKYTISATYKGQTVKNKLTVKQVLKLTKVKVKKSAKKLVLKATLKNGKKALKSKKVTFKFNGKKYKAKTNKKGIAKVTVKKSVLKKLKVGKKVKYQVTYLKDTVKRTAKVKR
jgi:predicted outer membrane repeat protein